MPDPTMTPEALERLLASVEPGRRATVTAFRPITGGYSRLSAVADVRWDDGGTERLGRRGDPPPGDGVCVSDRDAEWRILQALSHARSVPVARPRWYDATGEFFGTKCIVFAPFTGRSLQGVLRQAGSDPAPGRMFVDTVAQIHATPLDALGDAVERPGSWEDYVDGVLELYRAVDREVSESSPVLRYASALLARHRPPPVPFTLVHGDCQPSNVLVADTGGHVVIDWEVGRIGAPREDLGYYTQIPMPPNAYSQDPGRLPGALPRAHRAHRGAGQPRHGRVLPGHRHGAAARADPAGGRRPPPRAGRRGGSWRPTSSTPSPTSTASTSTSAGGSATTGRGRDDRAADHRA